MPTKDWNIPSRIATWPQEGASGLISIVTNPKSWDRKIFWQQGVVQPVSYLPAVVLGLLLNVLDALSYGQSCSMT